MQNIVKIAVRKIFSRTNPGNMINFSLLIYNNIQANLGLSYLWQTIQELLQPLMPSLGPYKNSEMSSEILSCEKWFLEGCCWLLDPENWLAYARKAEGPWNSLGNEAKHEIKTVTMYRKALRRKGQNFLGTKTVKGNLSSLEMVIYLADWRVKSCKVLVQ